MIIETKSYFFQKFGFNIQSSKAAKFLVYSIFGIFLIYSHSLVFMYFEDFAFSSLAFHPYAENVHGVNWTFSQFIDYIIHLYNTWSGRVLYPGIKILLLRESVWLFRIVQVISILFTFVFLCRFASKKEHNVWTVIFTCSLYGLFTFQMFRAGIFWFTASAIFVIPIVFVFLGFVIFRHLHENNEVKHGKLLIALGSISFFLASVSVETTSFTVTGALFLIILFTFFKPLAAKFNDKENEQLNFSVKTKKPAYPIIFFAASFIGSCVLLLAPGNFARFFSFGGEITLSHFSRSYAVHLFVFTIRHYSFHGGISILLFLLAAFVFSCAYILRKNNRLSKTVFFISIPYSILFLAGSLYAIVPDSPILDPANLIVMLLCHSYLTFMTIITVKYLLYIKDKFLLALFLGALFSQVTVLAYSSHYVERMSIILYYALFALFVRMFNDITKYIKLKTVIITILIPVLVLASISLAQITHRYALNRDVQIHNDRHLRQVSAEIKAGAEIEYIEVLDLVNVWGAYDMPDRTWYWVKRFYDIPLHIPIVKR